MLVRIRLDGQEEELSIIELQGHLTPRDEKQTLDALPLGVLDVAANKELTLVIGSSALVGKLVRLDKPLAVLAPDDRPPRDHDSGNDDDDEHWKVVGVVRSKLVFKTRPQPIVAKK